MFKDVMPLIADPVAFRETIDRLAAWAGPRNPDVILGAEARGSSSAAPWRMRSGAAS